MIVGLVCLCRFKKKGSNNNKVNLDLRKNINTTIVVRKWIKSQIVLNLKISMPQHLLLLMMLLVS